MIKPLLFSLFIVLGLLPCALALGTPYDPEWGVIQPKRIIRISVEAGADEISNGVRLRKAIDALVPGDQLEVGSGTYSVDRWWNVTISGTSEAPISIVSARDASVIITRPDAKQNILNLGQNAPVQYVVLRGLEFTGGSHGIRLGKCSHVWIDRCHIHHTGDVCLSANTSDSHHLNLTRNTIHNGGGTAEGMYLGGNNGEVIMSESVIALNHVYDCRGTQGDGIEVKQGSWGNLITENKVHDCNYPCITVYGTSGMPQNMIERNLCYRSLDSVMQVQGEAIVRNNVLIDGKNAAFASTDHQAKTTNLQVVHNTLINTNHAFRGGSWNDREKMVLANNVIYSKEQNAMHFPNGSQGVSIQGNVVLGDGAKIGSRLGRGIQDFTDLAWDASKLDTTPTQDAPFDCGVEAYRVQVDFAGKRRQTHPVISGAIER